MAYEESLRSITLNADASIAQFTGVPGQPGSASPHGGKQYHFVRVTGQHQCGLAGSGDADVMGVLQNKPQNVGNAATVGLRGVSKVVADGAITAGADVTVSANGRATTGGANVVGQALTTTANAGELISVLLTL